MLLLPWNRFVTTMVVTFEAADQSVLTNHTSVRLMASVFNVITAQGCIIIRDFQNHRQSCSSVIFLGLYHSFYIDATSICCGALARMCVCVCVCVCVCMRVCLHAYVCACMHCLLVLMCMYTYVAAEVHSRRWHAQFLLLFVVLRWSLMKLPLYLNHTF